MAVSLLAVGSEIFELNWYVFTYIVIFSPPSLKYVLLPTIDICQFPYGSI